MLRKNKRRQELNRTGREDMEKRERLTGSKEIRSFITSLFLLSVFVFLAFGWVFGIRPMTNDDMEPRISAGDLLFFFRLDDKLHNNEVITFKKEGIWYTARIVAQGGDTVEITGEEALKVNGSIVIESNIYETTPQYTSEVTYPLELKDEEYFVLCDHREGGKDSRYFGPVRKEEIKGKVITVIRRSNL